MSTGVDYKASLATSTEERRRLFVREAKSASALNYPNIVTICEISSAGEVTFIAMEYVEGRTLREELRAGRLSIPQALDYSIQLADALSVRPCHRLVRQGTCHLRSVDGLGRRKAPV